MKKSKTLLYIIALSLLLTLGTACTTAPAPPDEQAPGLQDPIPDPPNQDQNQEQE
ncbi:hypothetical protein [Heliorestis acidaminivorans]|uniref:hypothetical protein n=1 Tax=Heliorestis acidaminivorans TaxID=553427 RepID=UPI001478DEC4|nr:hypothetical protein [Heliorestis acidaminivorans]